MGFNFDNLYGKKSLEDVEITKKDVILRKGELNQKIADKTISATVDKDDETVEKEVIDNKNMGDTLEKDAEEVEKQKQTAGMVLLPIYRFEEKDKQIIVDYMKTFIGKAKTARKLDIYGELLPYLHIISLDDAEHKLNLALQRNKERTSTAQESLSVQFITLFFEKKLRLELKISEDTMVNKKDHKEYFDRKEELLKLFRKFINSIEEEIGEFDPIIMKYTITDIVKSNGDDDFGYGFAYEISYTRKIDYFTQRRSVEDYNDVIIEDDELRDKIYKQYNIHQDSKSFEDEEPASEDMSDMGDDSVDEEADDGDSGDEEFEGDDMSDGDDEFGGDDDFGGGEDELSGDGGDNSDDSDNDFGGSDDSSSKNQTGNPLKELNGKQYLHKKFRSLIDEIDGILKQLSEVPLPENVVVDKIVELRTMVENSTRLAYSQPSEESLLRYEMFVSQLRSLVNQLKTSVVNKKSK